MPRRPRFRTTAIGELFDGLRYAPAETLRRQMIDAEALASEIEPMKTYGRSETVYRITGFRTSGDGDDDASIVGQALLTDLSSLIERISERLHLRADERPGGALALDDAAIHLGVSTRTVLRYRSLGLAVHWIDFADARDGHSRRVGCFIESLERFRVQHLGAATRGRRARHQTLDLTQEIRRTLVSQATSLLAERPQSMRRIAALLAERHSVDSRRLRSLLASSGLSFAPRRRRQAHDVRLSYRAWRLGVDPLTLARRLGRDKAATWRAINAGRRRALRALELPTIPALPTFRRAEAAEVLLAPDAIRRGLFVMRFPRDALSMLSDFPPTAMPQRAGELDACRRLVAMRFLLWRAAQSVETIAAVPTSGSLDRIETDLRNAWLLRRTLVAHCLPAVLGRMEAALGGALAQLPAELLAASVHRAIAISASSLDSADSDDAAEGRLRVARHAALLMDRDLSLHALPVLERRAAAVHRGATISLGDPQPLIASWATAIPLLGCDPNRTASLTPGDRSLLDGRYGWLGEPALTIAELARREHLAPSLLQRRLSDAMSALGRI